MKYVHSLIYLFCASPRLISYNFALGLRIMEIEKIMEAASAEEKAIRAYQNQELKKSWESSIAFKTSKRPEPDFDPEATGISAAQIFSGEDRNKAQRLKEQKAQMTRWIQEQVAEQQYHKMLNKGDDENYFALMRAVDSIREAAEKEEIEMQKYLKDVVKEENAKVSIENLS